MSDDRTEIVLRAGAFQIFNDIVAQLCKLDRDAASSQPPRQRTQYRARGDVDAGYARKIEDHRSESCRRIIDQIDDLPADVLGVEVEPPARATHHERTGGIAGAGVARAIDEAPGARLAPEDDDRRPGRMRDQHDQGAERRK